MFFFLSAFYYFYNLSPTTYDIKYGHKTWWKKRTLTQIIVECALNLAAAAAKHRFMDLNDVELYFMLQYVVSDENFTNE